MFDVKKRGADTDVATAVLMAGTPTFSGVLVGGGDSLSPSISADFCI